MCVYYCCNGGRILTAHCMFYFLLLVINTYHLVFTLSNGPRHVWKVHFNSVHIVVFKFITISAQSECRSGGLFTRFTSFFARQTALISSSSSSFYSFSVCVRSKHNYLRMVLLCCKQLLSVASLLFCLTTLSGVIIVVSLVFYIS